MVSVYFNSLATVQKHGSSRRDENDCGASSSPFLGPLHYRLHRPGLYPFGGLCAFGGQTPLHADAGSLSRLPNPGYDCVWLGLG